MVLLVGRLFGVPAPRFDPTPPPVTAPAEGAVAGTPGTIGDDGGEGQGETGRSGRAGAPGRPGPAVTEPGAGAAGELQGIQAWLAARQPDWLRTLEELVRLESPSDDPEAVARCADRAATAFVELAGLTDAPGPGVTAPARRLRAGSGDRGVLLLCHVDTVWDRGSFAPMLGRDGDRLLGPGVFDMKGGVVVACAALAALRARSGADGPATVLLTGDEEVGSQGSRDLIEAAARDHDAVLVLEPPVGRAVKVGRKAVGEFRLTVSGRAAHAGIEPERGVNAVVELAAQVPRVAALADPGAGTTVTVGVVRGGTRSNVVPALATAEIDVRVRTAGEGERVSSALRGLRPLHPEARLEVTGGINRPPLERTATAHLFARAAQVAAALGWPPLEGAEVGGGSDGNLTGALGVPTLDGLGIVGGNAHAQGEWILPAELPARAALVAGLILDCWRNPPARPGTSGG